MMLKTMNWSRSRVIQLWFAAVVLAALAVVAVGADVTRGTGALLLALCLVPTAFVLVLWPGVEPQTAAEVLHRSE